MRLHTQSRIAYKTVVSLQSPVSSRNESFPRLTRLVRAFYRRVWMVRRRLMRFDPTRPRLHDVMGTPILVLPGVFDGVLTNTGAFLVQVLNGERLAEGARVLDLGCGSGIGAAFAARRGAHVVASDINPEAVRNAQVNALALHLEDKIETRLGDLFEPVRGERFDVVLFNPPYYRGAARSVSDQAWRSPDAFDRFLSDLPLHLAPQGRALVVLSTDGDIGATLHAARHLTIRVIRERNLFSETITVYELKPNQV